MPQMKKVSVLPSSILPKIDLGLESVLSSYKSQQDISSYLSLYSDMKASHLLTSEAESDGADSLPSKPRKRQRLDHLSQEEKIMRRKMKNRVAAQTARDRKKARMQELEEQVVELETDVKILRMAMTEFQSKYSALERENAELRLRLGQNVDQITVKEEESSPITESNEVNECESRLSDSSSSLEHAEGTGSTNSYSLDDAIRLLASNSETDALLDLLQQCSEDLLQCEDLTSPATVCAESRECKTPDPEVVGTPSKSLESNKELIHFDHIYYKQEDHISNPVVDPSLSSNSELSTKDSCCMDISVPLETDSVVEIDNSFEIPVICLSESDSPAAEVIQLDDFCHSQFDDQILYVSDSKPVASPVSSDCGYDSSFSVSSPSSSSAVDSWDESLTELFPSLV